MHDPCTAIAKGLFLGHIQLVQLQPWIGSIHLEIECRGLLGLLLIAIQLGKACGEGICDAEIHILMCLLFLVRRSVATRPESA